MVDLFGTKRIAALEAEKTELERKLTALQTTHTTTVTEYVVLQEKYSTLETASGKKDTKISGLETAVQTAEGKAAELEGRLTTLPNREITTLKAIKDLAGPKSNEGYDAFLKNMIRAVVDRGVLAYEDTLHNLLRGHEQRWHQKDKNPFPLIEDHEIHMYVGFSVLNDITKPQVSFIAANYPYLDLSGSDDSKSQKGAIQRQYGNSEPQVRLRFRNKHEAQDCYSRQQEKDMLDNLVPAEWQERLEVQKDVLLKAFAFGFVASYYEDAQTHPELPATLSNHDETTYDVPKLVLGMQERVNLMGSQSLLQDLYECVQATNPKFSAGVLSHFKQSQ